MKSLLLKLQLVSINRFKFILLFSIFFIYLENSMYFFNRFHLNKHSGMFSTFSNIIHLFSESLLALLVLMLLLFVISLINKYLLKTVCVIFLLLAGLFFYYITKVHLIIDSLLIEALFEPDPGEATAAFQWGVVWYFIIFGIAPALFIIFCIKIKKLANQLADIFSATYMPLNYISGVFSYSKSYIARFAGNANLISINKQDPFIFNNKLTNKPLTIVLVIGESARAENQSYNGYSRATNYYTEKIPNITYFKHMRSCGTFTIFSVPCMLSPMPKSKFKLPSQYNSLVSIFGDLGFKTWWISPQTSFVSSRDKNRVLGGLVNTAEVQYFASDLYQSNASNYANYDENLLRFLNRALQNNSLHKLIVLHIRGSHFFYKERYPNNRFSRFSASCNANDTANTCIAKQTEAEYDNSALYTDWFLAQVISKLKNKNSFLLYASDHGESLKVDKSGFLLHGAPYDSAPSVQKHVASMMWFSDSMRKLMPENYKNMQSYATRDISHDYIFNSMFDCLGIKSKAVNSDISLCKSNN